MPDLPPSHRPLRATFVDVPLIYNSGVGQVMYQLARHRRPEALDMLVVCLDAPGTILPGLLGAVGVGVRHIGNAGVLRSARKLRDVLKEQAADVVVANSFRCYLVAKLAVAGTGTPVAFWIHTINQLHTGRARKIVFPLLVRRDALIYVSDAVRANNRPRTFQGRDAVIYNPVEAPECRPEWQPYPPQKRAELGIPDHAVVLGYTAQFVYYKGQTILLDAFDRLSSRFPELYLVLLGDGPDRAAATARARQFAAGDRVLFLGPRTDARALLGVVDLYVHVAPEEAFGLAVVEAMLARKPVIAARAHALPELIRDGETGLLFAPGDVQDLERQITHLIENRAAAARLAAAGEQEARRRFRPEPFARQVTGFLQAVVARRSGPPQPSGQP